MNDQKIRRYADLVVLIIGSVLLSYLFFKHIFIYLVPFLGGWFIAFALRPIAARISDALHIKPRILRLVLTVLMYTALVGALVGGVWLLSREVWELLGGIGEGESEIGEVLAGITDKGRFFGRLFGELGDYVAEAIYRVATSLLSSLGSLLTGLVSRVPRVLFFLLVSVIASAYFAVSLEDVNGAVRRILPRRAVDMLVRLKDGFFGAFLRYLRAYLLLLVITFLEMMVGLFLLRAPYPLLMAIVIAALDLLPVIGVGSVLIPWGVWSLVMGRTGFGVGLLVLFAAHTVLRQIIEPRIVGKNLGVHPLLTLFFIYVGYSVFGIIGLLLVPLLTVLIKVSFSDLGKDDATEVTEPTGTEGNDA